MPKKKANSKQSTANSKKKIVSGKRVKQKAESRKLKAKTGLVVEVVNFEGKNTKIQLPEKVFKTKVFPQILAQAVRVYLANQRKGTAKTKTRSEVSGGGAKPWRQKGTGRARQGSIRAPHWRKGGVVFGPTSRDFSLKLPKKVKLAVLFGAISLKFGKGEIKFVDNFERVKPKTAELAKALENIELHDAKTLWVIGTNYKNLVRAGRNLPNLTFCRVENLTPYEVLANKFLIMNKNVIERLTKKVE